MCGIVGLVTKQKKQFYAQHLDLFEEMLVCDSVRGSDSTGAFSVLSNNQVKAVKVATNPHYLLSTKQWTSFRDSAIRSSHILVGHNRKATFGSISRENAHPFCEKNIVLVHNGTVQDHKTMADVDVDSHAICHQISEVGAQATLKELKGAYTLVWYDVTTKKLNLARNPERPLVFVDTADVFAFASEGWMLGWLLARNNIGKVKLEVLPENKIYSLAWDPYRLEIEDIQKKVYQLPVKRDFSANDDITEWQKYNSHYPKESSVIFCPHVTVEDSLRKGKFKMKGIAYLPGKPIFQNAIAILDDTYDEADAMDLNNEEKLTARIRNVILTEQGQICVYLDQVKPDIVIELWNNVTIPEKEWLYFVDHFTCDKCNHPLKKEDNQLTMITKEADGHKVTCCDCILRDAH